MGVHTRDDVISTVKSVFPGRNEADILRELDRYGVESWERERERVQIAIVKLSGGDQSKLPYLIETAKRDYRDVLCWLETGPLSETEGRDLTEQARRIIERWENK